MNGFPNSGFWFQSLGPLALQAAVVAGLAAGLQPFLKSAQARRTVWLGALLGMVFLVAGTVTGADRAMVRWMNSERGPKRTIQIQDNLPATLVLSGNPMAGTTPPAISCGNGTARSLSAVWWPVWLWLAGAFVVGTRALGSRLLLAWLVRRSRTFSDAKITERVALLAGRLGLRRRVRLMESSSLLGPIAFGWWRPTVGLPGGFFTVHSMAEQDTMLAHELAHLAVRDPFWMALADLLSVLLWWHPAVWWLRHQFRVASEAAADEASLLVEDGPALLAGCLVALAIRLQDRSSSIWLGMAGFRSGLGRRVERLLQMASEGAVVPARGGIGAAWISGVAAVVAGLLVGTVFALPPAQRELPSLLTLAEAAWLPSSASQTDSPDLQSSITNSRPEPVWSRAAKHSSDLLLKPGFKVDSKLSFQIKFVDIEASSDFDAAIFPMPSSNAILREVRGDEIRWSGCLATNAHDIRICAISGSPLTGILTGPQYRALLQTLEKHAGVEMLSAPSLTMLSGRQGQVSDIEHESISSAFLDPTSGLPVTYAGHLGHILDVMPGLLSDGETIVLTVCGSITQSMGSDPADPGSDASQPHLLLWNILTTVNVLDGQTLVLGCPGMETGQPGATKNTNVGSGRKRFLVFITTTITYPAADCVLTKQGIPLATDSFFQELFQGTKMRRD